MDSRKQDLIEAMLRVVGSKGYGAAAVRDVLAEAGASRTTFYKHFRNKHDCFLSAYETAIERLHEAVARGCDAERPWLERMTAGLEAVVEVLAQDPPLARATIVEVNTAGADARRLHWDAIVRFGEGMSPDADLFEADELPVNTALLAASGVAGLILEQLLVGEAEELPALLPDLSFALLVPFVGPGAATEAMWQVAAVQDSGTAPAGSPATGR